MRIAARMMLEFEVSLDAGMPFEMSPSRALETSPKVTRVDMVRALSIIMIVSL